MPNPKKSKAKKQCEQSLEEALKSAWSVEQAAEAIETARFAEHLLHVVSTEFHISEAAKKHPDLYWDYLHAKVELLLGKRVPKPADRWLDRATNYPQ